MGGSKGGITAIIFGVLLLVVGLVLSDIIVDNVNKNGARIGCFDGNDVPIKNANGPQAAAVAGASSAALQTAVAGYGGQSVPKKVGSSYQGGNVIGDNCGTTVTSPATGLAAWGSPTCTSPATCGTVRYDLEVYGADSLNNLFTLVYWIVLVSISLALVGGGGYSVYRQARGSY